MKVDVGNNNDQSVYYNKARLEHASNGNVVNLDYKLAAYDNKIKAVCNIIAKLNDFTESETKIYTYLCTIYDTTNTLDAYTKEDITNFVCHKYLYNPVTINRCFDKFVKCGIIRITKDNYVILNDNFNVAKTVKDSIYFNNGDVAGVVSDFAVVVNFRVPSP